MQHSQSPRGQQTTVGLVLALLMIFSAVELSAQGRYQWGKWREPAGPVEQPGEGSPGSHWTVFHWTRHGVFTSAEVCADCHRASTDGSGEMRIPHQPGGKDISPSPTWRHSMMANAWYDPYFQATVEDQVAEFPGYAGNIEDKCLNCHSPMGHAHAHATGQELDTADCTLVSGCYRMESTLAAGHAREGVSCTFCHQMTSPQVPVPGSGNYRIPEQGDPASRTIYGPYANPVSRPMRNFTDYALEQSDYVSSSEHCATCHDLETPVFDVNSGHPVEPPAVFREQAPYAEWRNSRFGNGGEDDKSCQDCHMPSPPDYATRIAVMRSGTVNRRWPERQPYSVHGLSGGNTYVLGLLKTWREELGIAQLTSEQGFVAAIAEGREFLRQAADVSLSCQSRDSGLLQLCVTVTNRSGHKLPTGYPSRRMWVQLVVTDSRGDVLFESGSADENGYLTLDSKLLDPACLAVDKSEGFSSTNCYESHHDLITRPDEVAIYEAVMADSNADVTYSLLHAAGYLKDNRLPPAGFSSLAPNFDAATAVAGAAARDDSFNRADGMQGTGRDTVHYRIPLSAKDAGQLSVTARLWYQSVRPAFVMALRHGGSKVRQMQHMYRKQPPLPELLAEDELTLQ